MTQHFSDPRQILNNISCHRVSGSWGASGTRLCLAALLSCILNCWSSADNFSCSGTMSETAFFSPRVMFWCTSHRLEFYFFATPSATTFSEHSGGIVPWFLFFTFANSRFLTLLLNVEVRRHRSFLLEQIRSNAVFILRLRVLFALKYFLSLCETSCSMKIIFNHNMCH